MTLTTPALAAPTASSRAEHSGPTAGTHGVPNHPFPTRLGEPLNPHQEATPMSLHYYATPTAACPSCDSMATLDALGIKFGVRQQSTEYFLDELPNHKQRALRDVATIHVQHGRAVLLRVAPDLLISDLPAIAVCAFDVAAHADQWTTVAMQCPHLDHQDCQVIGVAIPATARLDEELEALTAATQPATTTHQEVATL